MKKVLGIILELNPLHNGHKYFIDTAKSLVNPDVTVAIISTNFTMRGEINVINKFDRTKMLLDLGIDIVLELPFNLGVLSADYFAYNSINSLNKLQITDLAFGAELDDLDKLKHINELTTSDLFNNELRKNLDKGYSYSTSCNNALKLLTNDLDIITNYSLPNNTLGLQYLRAIEKINPNINVTLIKRIDNNYYDKELNQDNHFASATTLRNLLQSNIDISKYVPLNNDLEHNIYIDIKKANSNLFNLLYYKSLMNDLVYYGNKEGIENRLEKNIKSSKTLYEVVEKTITKRYTINYINRLILHIINETDIDFPITEDYVRVLGFNNNVKSYFKTLKCKKDIITNIKDTNNIIANNELKATKLYSLLTENYELYLNEYKIPIIKE